MSLRATIISKKKSVPDNDICVVKRTFYEFNGEQFATRMEAEQERLEFRIISVIKENNIDISDYDSNWTISIITDNIELFLPLFKEYEERMAAWNKDNES